MDEKTHNNIDISYLLTYYLSGKINAKEQVLLDAWLMEDKSHQLLLQDLLNKKLSRDRQAIIERIDMDKEWARFQKTISLKKKTIRINWTNALKYVAVIALPLLIGTYVFMQNLTPEENLPEIFAEIEPGVKKAQLILSNGEKIELGENRLDLSNQEENVRIEDNNKSLNYTSLETNSSKLRYNYLLIGRGEEYQLTLADGTKVWLNSESKLTYPTQFASHIREVELEGEAYFEVMKNVKAPFFVKTKQMNIEVLGTSFNVSVYQDEENMKATLVEGSVKIVPNYGNSETLIIKPNEQAIFNIYADNINIKTVDAQSYGRWRVGVFAFNEATLEEIMRKLSRWYKIRIFFQDDVVRNYQFSGKLPRFKTCNVLLEMIEKTTDIQFEIKDTETVIISTKK